MSSNLLSSATVAAIAELAGPPVRSQDVQAAFQAVGIRPRVPFLDWVVPLAQDPTEHVRLTLQKLDLADPDVVAQVIRVASRLAEFSSVGSARRADRVVRLRNCLSDDGYTLDPAGDPIVAIAALAATANSALADAAAIRLELTRLERALPDDPSAAIGKAKNLIEATCKAVLRNLGETAEDAETVPALVNRAARVLGVHSAQAAGPHAAQIRKLLGRLPAMTHDIAELRNLAGDGHGMGDTPEIDVAAGRLAARAAIAWCAFMLEVLPLAGKAPAGVASRSFGGAPSD